MSKKQKSTKRQEESSFLTPDFLRKQKLSLEAKLSDCQNLQKLAREEIKICPPDDRRGDALERAFTYSERERAAQLLNDCRKIFPQIKRALGLINNSLILTGRKSGENYGECIGCKGLMSQKRLEAVPWALRCILCQELEDAGENAPTLGDHS